MVLDMNISQRTSYVTKRIRREDHSKTRKEAWNARFYDFDQKGTPTNFRATSEK